ncbi:MAG TPA: DNRLRE domain-containing protein [Anaerolineae bacterium]|nr:DNRLRE domain-containing protein [Anaerolineae bacterium]HQK13196.1 DNRLRE domain-containing protein [Anaerolineae bacterium]
MKRTIGLTLALAWTLLGVAAASAYPASPPNHDTYVDVNSPDDNFNANLLELSGSTSSCELTSFTFLQWNLSHIPAYAEVTTATLALTVTGAMNVEAATRVALYATGDAWTEDTLTYANAPALGTKLDSQPLPLEGETLIFSNDALRLYLEDQLAENRIASFALLLEGTCSSGVTMVLFNDREQGVDFPELYLETAIRPADLALAKAGPSVAYPGQMVTYTLTYTNVGNIPVSMARVTDTLPMQVQVRDYTEPATLSLMDNTMTWDLTNLAPGVGGVLTVTGIVDPGFTGVFTNVATIATTTIESDTTNNVTPPIVTTVLAPDLAIHKSGPTIASPGDVITYTLTYTNVGNASAPYVTITDLLPQTVQLYAHSGTVIMPSPAVSLTWEVFNLAPNAGGILTVSVVVSPTFTGWLTNTATIATTAPEVAFANNTSVAYTFVESPPPARHYLYLPLVMRALP